MALPTTPISETNLLTEDSDPNLARIDLLAFVRSYNDLLDAVGVPSGLATLDADGKLATDALDGAEVVSLIAPLAGSGSGFDSDTLDGAHGSEFIRVDGAHDWVLTSAPQNVTFATPSGTGHHMALRFSNQANSVVAGYGVDIGFVLSNASGPPTAAATVGVEWITATAAAETSAVTFGTRNAGTLETALKYYQRRFELTELSGTPSGHPTAASGKWWLYFKSDGLYIMDDVGAEVHLGAGSGSTDHGTLTGILDDDHTQYLLVSGTRAMTGNLVLGANLLHFTDRADPASPPSGQVYLYAKAQELYYKTAAGTVVGPLGAGGGGGSSDHGTLTGLLDDDHTNYLLRQPTADVVINNAASDYDFTIKAPGLATMFKLDAGFGAIGINRSPASGQGYLQVASTTTRAALTIDHTGAEDAIRITKTGGSPVNAALYVNNTTAGINAAFVRDAASSPGFAPVLLVSDNGGTYGGDFAMVVQTAATGKGAAVFYQGGSSTEVFSIKSTEVVVNEGGSTLNFRVEGDTASQLLNVLGANDVVNVNGALTTGRLNVTGGGLDAIYAVSATAGRYAATFEQQAGGYAARFIGNTGTGRGGGLIASSLRDQAATFTKNLSIYSVLGAYAVGIYVETAADSADALFLSNVGTGDYLRCQNDALEDLFRIPAGGGTYWTDRSGDMTAPGAGSHGLYFKSDGLYIRTPTGVEGPIGAGGGRVESAAGAVREPDHFEELVTCTGGAAEVYTTATIPIGCYIERVLVRVVTAVSGGFHAGVDGDDTRYAASITGNVGDTNLDADETPAPHPNGSLTTKIKLTHASGTFSGVGSPGQVRVTVFFVRFTAATS